MICHLFLFIYVPDLYRDNQDRGLVTALSTLIQGTELAVLATGGYPTALQIWVRSLLAMSWAAKHSFPDKKWSVPVDLQGIATRVSPESHWCVRDT